jgi:hypothetical protein
MVNTHERTRACGSRNKPKSEDVLTGQTGVLGFGSRRLFEEGNYHTYVMEDG